MDSRITSLVRRDRLLAVAFTVLMWVFLALVYFAASSVASSTTVSVVLLASMLMLGAFNTASIVGMIRTYAANRDLIYREDILNLDRARQQRAGVGRAV
ncbi:hypothetical protein HC028_13620 [Planosporangium flavigriseum]|uniref:hypothetical protein n=1 Tax=Planosporangium flavigriseum TaxID=373681 RepID=UPI00143BF40C|nr:hypothetical protein [Planosporangium flavigriseum]NJC65534.1 hypothetical protein [Planosporangium flavigriseum]